MKKQRDNNLPPQRFSINDVVVVHKSDFYWRVTDIEDVFFKNEDIFGRYGDRQKHAWVETSSRRRFWTEISEKALPGDYAFQGVTLVRWAGKGGNRLNGQMKSYHNSQELVLASQYIEEELKKFNIIKEMIIKG